jgi:uncharacterized protein (DUF302 family)
MRTSHWFILASSLFVAPFAGADSPPQATESAPQAVQPAPQAVQPAPEAVQAAPEAVQAVPQAVQTVPQVMQPVIVAPAVPLPSPWVNQMASPFPGLPFPGLPGANPWMNQMPQQNSAAMPFSFIPYIMPNMLPNFGPAQAPRKPYTMHAVIPEGAKQQMMQMMMPMMTGLLHMSMADAMNWFAYKIKAKPGLSFDDVVESMKLRANQLNFKYVSSNLMWKDFQAVLGDKEAPRIEVHSFCDIAVARHLLKISPEFLVFLPCRIAVMEDADKNIWVMMLDWDMSWVAGYEQQMGLSSELSNGAFDIRRKMGEIMKAGANGDL